MADVKESLTETQAKVFKYMKESFFTSGSMPTLREICQAMKWKAIGSAQDAVEILIKKGFIEKDPQKARGLRLANDSDFRPAPLLGSAPAGNPIESLENHEGDVLVPTFLRGPLFAVRVRGDSMMDAGIFDDDIVIVRQSEAAKDNDIVVAMLEGEVTIKRLKKRGEERKSESAELWLYPENKKYSPRKVNDASFRILGIVLGLHRYW